MLLQIGPYIELSSDSELGQLQIGLLLQTGEATVEQNWGCYKLIQVAVDTRTDTLNTRNDYDTFELIH